MFEVLPDGQGETLRKKLFVKVCGVLVSDRATALKFWVMERRQICWAHLVRTFVSFSQRDGPAGPTGEELLEYTAIIFDYWSMFRQGQLSRAELIARMAPVRLQAEASLERAVAKNIKRACPARARTSSSTARRCGPSSSARGSNRPTTTLSASCGPSCCGAGAGSAARANVEIGSPSG